MNQSASDRRHEDELTLSDLITPLVRYKWRFLMVWLVCILITGLTVAYLRPNFTSSGTIYFESSAGGSTNIGLFAPLMGGDGDLASHQQILAGRRLASDVIEKLGLNAELEGPREYLPERPHFWRWKLEGTPESFERGLRVRSVRLHEAVYRPITYQLHFTDSEHFTVLGPGDKRQVAEGRLGQLVTTPTGSFVLDAAGDTTVQSQTRFDLKLVPVQLAIRDFQDSLVVIGSSARSPRDQHSLIEVRYSHPSPFMAREVVDTLIDSFLNLNRYWETTVSRATMEFVREQLEAMKLDMDQAYDRLSQFQAESGLIRLDPQLEEEVASLVQLEAKLREERLRLFNLHMLRDSLDEQRADVHLSAFVDEPLIRQFVMELAQLDGEIAAMQTEFQPGYPPLRRLQTVRREKTAALREALGNFLKKAEAGIDELSEEIERYRAQFSQLPAKSRSLAEYVRSTALFENLYLELLREKQRASIAEASTLSNFRRVDAPLLPLRESSPNAKRWLLLGTGLGLLVATLVVLVPAFTVRWFTSADEVRRQFSQLPVFGVLPRRQRTPRRASAHVIEHNAQSPFAEAIRLMRANVLHTMAGRAQQVLLLTSAMPGDGKSSIVSNLACSLARAPRVNRVLLIDADMHHPSLQGVFDLPQSPGLSDYLNGDVDRDRIIYPVQLDGDAKLDLIPAGPVPPVPADLVETEAMARLIEYARQNYTFTLIDTAPYPAVALATILAPLADRTLSVCSVGRTHRVVFRQHLEDLQRVSRHNGLVLNLISVDDAPYIYGYGYGNDRTGRNGTGGNGLAKTRKSPQRGDRAMVKES